MRHKLRASTNRRAFLLEKAPLAVSALSLAQSTLAAASGPNDTLGIGFIGVGGRNSAHLSEMVKQGSAWNVRIVGLCDVWQVALARASNLVSKNLGYEPAVTTRFEELLARPDLDAVVVATPDFSHAPILIAALKAGKDVYIEKPMTIDLESANQALDLATAGNRVVQAGTQRRSDGHFISAAKVVSSGVLGQLSRATAAVGFNEPRWKRDTKDTRPEDVDWKAFLLDLPDRPFDPSLLREWQIHKETSNGLPGLWMTHYADSLHFVTGAKYPTSAVALGGTYVWKDGREHTDTFHTLLEYPEGFLFDWAMGLGNAAGWRYSLHGTKGTLDLEKWTITAEARGAKPEPIQPLESVSHLENWVQCLRSREQPNASIMAGHQHVVATVLAARALETGRLQKYDAANRRIVEG